MLSPSESSSRDNLKYLENYVSAFKDICAHYSIPILDLYHVRSPNFNIEYIRDTHSYIPSSTGIANGVHTINKGHEIIARKIEEFLKKL